MPLKLHDVEDGERLAAWVIHRSQITLSPEDFEDAHQYLLLELWRLFVDFDPTGGRPFALLATTVLGRRLVDWQRKQFGRTIWRFGDGRVYERKPPVFVEFNDSVIGRLDAAEPARGSDRETGGDEAVRGLLAERDSKRAQDLELLGLSDAA